MFLTVHQFKKDQFNVFLKKVDSAISIVAENQCNYEQTLVLNGYDYNFFINFLSRNDKDQVFTLNDTTMAQHLPYNGKFDWINFSNGHKYQCFLMVVVTVFGLADVLLIAHTLRMQHLRHANDFLVLIDFNSGYEIVEVFFVTSRVEFVDYIDLNTPATDN